MSGAITSTASGPITATVVALLFALRRSPVPIREKIQALEKTTALLRMRADEVEIEELERLLSRS